MKIQENKNYDNNNYKVTVNSVISAPLNKQDWLKEDGEQNNYI